MRKLLFVLALGLFASFGINAQNEVDVKTETPKCCASKATASVKEPISVDFSQAMLISMKRQNVTKKECAETGAISYYMKEVSESTGKVVYKEVEFDTNEKQFVNVSPNDIGDANALKAIKVVNMEETAKSPSAEGKASCSKKDGAKCCAGKKAKKAEGTN